MTIDTEPLTITHSNCPKLRVKTLRICGDVRKASLAILLWFKKRMSFPLSLIDAGGAQLYHLLLFCFKRIKTRKIITSPSYLPAIGRNQGGGGEDYRNLRCTKNEVFH